MHTYIHTYIHTYMHTYIHITTDDAKYTFYTPTPIFDIESKIYNLKLNKKWNTEAVLSIFLKIFLYVALKMP